MASITFDPTSIPLAAPAAAAFVVRYGGGGFSYLPNVLCLDVRRGCGPDPGSARFRYILDVLNPAGIPARVEDVLGLDKSGPYVVRHDDRICVLVSDGYGYTVLFDGYAQVPQGDLSPESESATFEAVGVGVRCWDAPLGGAVMRGGPDIAVVKDVATDHPARANPDGRSNRVPDGAFAGTAPDLYPTFVDPALAMASGARAARWTVADLAAYILAEGNDGAYVTSPKLSGLADVLADRSAGSGLLDPADQPSTPIPCQDIDVTGEPWPEALAKLIRPHNVDFAFATSADSAGKPLTYLVFFRTDDADNSSPKALYLQRPGQPFSPAATNINGLALARDGARIANDIVVDTRCTRHEVGVVLAPGFTPAGADVANKLDFDQDSPTYVPANQDKYRVYVANEGGDGYYDFPTSSWKTSPACNLDAAFGAPVTPALGGDPYPRYASHRRPARGELFSYDTLKERKRARLYISSDYNQPIPGLWDRSGTWCEVKSGWELLPDRLGVRITTAKISDLDFAPNPVPGFGTTTPVNAGGKLSLVESQNASAPPSNAQQPRVYFLLVCVVESDKGLGAEAYPRAASIASRGITRRVDARDRFVKDVVSASSIFNATAKDTTDPALGGRDDTGDATAYAEAIRATTENPSVEGSATIPRISGAYEVGDKISGVAGRNIDLRTNGGAGQGEAAQYAIVTGITWSFEPRQATTLHFSDVRKEAAPPPEHQS